MFATQSTETFSTQKPWETTQKHQKHEPNMAPEQLVFLTYMLFFRLIVFLNPFFWPPPPSLCFFSKQTSAEFQSPSCDRAPPQGIGCLGEEKEEKDAWQEKRSQNYRVLKGPGVEPRGEIN